MKNGLWLIRNMLTNKEQQIQNRLNKRLKQRKARADKSEWKQQRIEDLRAQGEG